MVCASAPSALDYIVSIRRMPTGSGRAGGWIGCPIADGPRRGKSLNEKVFPSFEGNGYSDFANEEISSNQRTYREIPFRHPRYIRAFVFFVCFVEHHPSVRATRNPVSI
jgi:hypothetical protein